MQQSIKLQFESISQVPLNKYEKDFTFIVNGEKFITSKIVADLLSPKISKIHSSNPIFNEFSFQTKSTGDFERFISLINFEKTVFTDSEISFITDVIEVLGTEKIDLEIKKNHITIDNVVDKLQSHSQSENLFSQEYSEEINFLSQHFHEINKAHQEDLCNLSLNTLREVMKNSNFQIETEDELLYFINKLYLKSSKYSDLYEYVCFSNVTIKAIDQFVSIFDIKDLNQGTWMSLSNRLKHEIVFDKDNKCQKEGYDVKSATDQTKNQDTKGFCEILYLNKDFEGIFHYLQKQSDIDDEVKVTFSSFNYGDPQNLIHFDNNDFFGTGNKSNSWICFEFTNKKIIPTNYTIKSCDYGENWIHPRSWVVEGSENSENWEKLDEQNDCSYLKGSNLIHTFPIQNSDHHEFKYIRIRQTGFNWKKNNCLYFNTIEFYGLIN